MDRRQFKRIDYKEPVQFTFNEPQESVGSLSADISEGGVKLKLFQFYPLGSQISLSLPLPSEKTLECLGRIVWIEQLPYSDYFQAGVAFEDSPSSVYPRNVIKALCHA